MYSRSSSQHQHRAGLRAAPRRQYLPLAIWAIWGSILAPLGSAHASEEGAKKDETEQLAPVIVQSNRVPVSKTVMSGEELGRVAGTSGDPMRALQSLPGVVATSDSNAAPAIRGSRPGDNAYYIDFLPVGYVYHLGGYLSTVHPELVKQFELYTGAFGPEFDDVHGGIVDISLRQPRNDRLGGQIRVGALGADVLVEGPVTENQSFYFAAKKSYIDLLIRGKQTDKDSGVIYTMPKFQDYQGKYSWRLNESNTLSFHATGAQDQIKFTVPADTDMAIQDPALAGDSKSKESSNTQAVVWDNKLNARVSNKLAVGHMDSHSKGKFGSAADADVKVDNFFVRDQLRLRLGEDHDVALGTILFAQKYKLDLDLLDARCTEFDPACDLTSAERKKFKDELKVNYAIFYAKDRWQLTPELAATAGLHFTRDGYLNRNYTEPRLGLEWRAFKNTTFNMGWGKHNQFPDGLQVLQNFGNPKLGHMQATHSVLGVSQALADGWSVKTEVYQKKFDNFVIADPKLNYVNGGSGDASGVELFIKKDALANAKLSGWLSVSLAKARRQNDVTGHEFKFEYDQPVVVNLVGNYKYSDKWQFGAKWSYHSGNLFTPVVGTGTHPDGRVKPIYGELNSERLPNYHRLDLRVDQVVSPTLSFYYELLNAYAQKNISGYTYTADYKKRRANVELGITPNVGLDYKF
ncbi:TonB-dependent receptor plug domain-containing protein [Roseateles albus]|uniref:TonB-dependent receptor n=1 Tax=Roseateles albus TaxID=2987525 RepID=A0ABT5K869_9BURK|nr:TonB-dependent receptor plug domain-containing protein [Roseateles albus]MDC8770156.1 TonB-dependent receptor [Roseateles albus]